MMQLWRMITSQSLVACGMVLFVILLVELSVFSISAYSHELRPAIVDFSSTDKVRYELDLKFNLESWLAKIDNNHSETSHSPNATRYNRMRGLTGGQLEQLLTPKIPELEQSIVLVFDGNKHFPKFVSSDIPPVGDIDLTRDTVVRFTGVIPAGVTNLVWRYQLGASVFRIAGVGDIKTGQKQEKIAVYVNAGEESQPIVIAAPIKSDFTTSLVSYISTGFNHIIPKGLDHILFVVGLFLLSSHWSPLFWQVSAFTLAHTLTLGLAMTGKISLPANIVEPLIAASIVYIAIENLFMNKLSFWRPVIVFLFGLLHGLGFAGVLTEFGLGSGSILAGLIGFNIGVELGQLSVIAGCYALVGIWFGRKIWYHERVTVPGSLLIGIVGSWWFFQRVMAA